MKSRFQKDFSTGKSGTYFALDETEEDCWFAQI